MRLLFFSISLILSFAVSANTFSRNEYIEQWKPVAQNNMKEYGIPASIILAQGILESGYGNSDLARHANNHFGIKCHSTWTGAKYIKDDDKKNECFRSYDNAMDSYRDHALFLKNGKRYASLFELDQSDYKGWAHGLKNAGYATNPKYAEKLITVIEDNQLYNYDDLNGFNTASIQAPKPSRPVKQIVTSSHVQIRQINKVQCVQVGAGQTLYKISKETGVSLRQLYKYNDFGPQQEVVSEGEFVYLQPKRLKSKGKKDYKVSGGQTLREISQKEGVKLKSLMRKNNISDADALLKNGSKIKL
jgi:LysM repeat protein